MLLKCSIFKLLPQLIEKLPFWVFAPWWLNSHYYYKINAQKTMVGNKKN